jgi:hypothetical protein
MEFVVDRMDTGAGFLRIIRFPLSILILPTASRSPSSSGVGAIVQIVADASSEITSHPTLRNKQKNTLAQEVKR